MKKPKKKVVARVVLEIKTRQFGKTEAMLQKRYKKLCPQCAMGREPVRREITFGRTQSSAPVFMWLHDSVAACKAGDLREERHQLLSPK